MHDETTDDLVEEEEPEEPQYLALPIYEDRQCKIKNRIGVRCTVQAAWQVYIRPEWTPVCIMHMHMLLSDYRKQRLREQEDLRLDVLSWRKTASLSESETNTTNWEITT